MTALMLSQGTSRLKLQIHDAAHKCKLRNKQSDVQPVGSKAKWMNC